MREFEEHEDDNVVPLERPRFVLGSDVTMSAVEWLWPGYFPLGKLIILDGDPGLLKTTISLDIAARVTRGASMPDGSKGMAGGVVFLGFEDDVADTVVPRFVAAGGDPGRLLIMDTIDGLGGPRPVTIPDDVSHIESAIEHVQAKLVIVDPLMAALGLEVKSHADQHVRRALVPLRDVASRHVASILLIRHWTKDEKVRNLLYRGGGSIGITGAARAAFAVARDPEHADWCVFIPVKSNLSAETSRKALRYRVVDHPELHVATVEWLGNLDPQQVLDALKRAGAPVDESAVGEAIGFLSELLDRGPVQATEAGQYMKEAGVSPSTLKRAKKRLGVRARPITDAKGKSHWWWSLPSTKGGS